MPLEAALVVLEKSFIQLETLGLYSHRISSFRFPLLGPSQDNVSKTITLLLSLFQYHLTLIPCFGRKNEQSLLTLLGSMYSSVIFCGINNSQSILPHISRERPVFYRERFSGMYASWGYSAAQLIIEIPYVLVQALVFTGITYPMIGYYWSAYKVFLYFYSMFTALLYYTYLGMLLIAITPSFPVAATLQSAFYTTFNLFAGFLIPRPVSFFFFFNIQ